jgi:hypothetical protein
MPWCGRTLRTQAWDAVREVLEEVAHQMAPVLLPVELLHKSQLQIAFLRHNVSVPSLNFRLYFAYNLSLQEILA